MTQTSLFRNIKAQGLLIEEAARISKVSTATIRNWIKTGYLSKEENGLISHSRFEEFINNSEYKKRLNSRANKSGKDSHNHDQLTSNMLQEIAKNNNSLEHLGAKYEDSLSDSYRNKEGIYYTPKNIVIDLLKEENFSLTTKTFCDPCCGSGNFIMRAIDLGFRPENIYGFDIDPIAVEITKKRILEKTGYNSNNIKKANFLEYVATKQCPLFDYIFTNPPWGKKIDKKEKQRYSKIFNTGDSVDTSSLFFFASIKVLNKDGRLGFLLPEAFFNISAFKAARKKAMSLTIERLVDYGKSFKNLLTKAQAIVLKNKPQEDCEVSCETNEGKFKRPMKSFICNPKSIFNFHCSLEASEVIKHIFSLPHITLKEKAMWGLGIVTGNNKKFFKSNLENGYMPIYRGSDITKKGLKPAAIFIPKNISLYQQVAPIELYEAPQKLMYKFISSKLCFYLDTKQNYVLNSANILIPSSKFPLSCKQLCDLLNSNFMNWLFQNIYNTHKILRGDLESLPIHANYFKKFNHFDEMEYLKFLNVEITKHGTFRIKR